MKKRFPTIILIFVFCLGLSLLLYPTISDYWNSFHQSRAIASYTATVARMDDDQYEEIWESAVAYNKRLAESGNTWILTDEQREDYENQLDVGKTGIMCYVEIPKITCKLPVYHGTGEGILQIALGHIEGSSLPVGGESTHCVISGHRGLPSAKLFTNLDQLVEGDTFMIQTLDETLTYEVDQIRIVLPNELQDLVIEEGQDYCTLVTCTPYGVNSHRLLVRGHRIPNQQNADRVTADAVQIEALAVAPFIAAPILIIILIILLIKRRSQR